ncbi:MAG TPA: TIGR01777 family oxidoreductase, partial [Burkholderiaceae bacterium]|nr:TIGR01777 family oxidoreductase [Burkholderiaceae bacterium]
QRPEVLLSGSAVGLYGDGGDRVFDEGAPRADDFAAGLCADWEAAARQAEALGVRVVLLRTGLVLSREGGLLARMKLPFSLGLGARLGDGRQWMSWIHADDWQALVLRLLDDAQARGAYNLTAPEPVTNAGFTAGLAAALHRPAVFAAPAWGLKLALGEMAPLLLGGQRVRPERALAAGFTFRHPTLDGALRDLLG